MPDVLWVLATLACVGWSMFTFWAGVALLCMWGAELDTVPSRWSQVILLTVALLPWLPLLYFAS